VFLRVVERRQLGGKTNYHLIVYSLGNISAKTYQNQLTYDRVTASQVSVVF